MSLQQYNVDLSDVAEWLPWGGLTLPYVLENKNGSMISVIKYEALDFDAPPVDEIKFSRGWALWSERQRYGGENSDFLVICWNPFAGSGAVKNTLGKPIREERVLEYFAKAVQMMTRKLSKVTSATLLEYQEIIDFLSFTLALGMRKWEMPEVPLYLDVYLSQDLGLRFDANEISMKNRRYLVCSVLGAPNLDSVHKAFSSLAYRHIKRLLCLDMTSGKKEISKYASRWCSGRKYIKNEIFHDLVNGTLCGYASEYFIFLLDKANYNSFRDFAENLLQQKGIPYRMEEFFFKDIWWGSLPGIYQADINPPAQFYSSLGEIMEHKPLKKRKTVIDDEIKIQTIRLRKGGML